MSQTEAAVNNAEHVHRDDIGARMGMWLFLFTEVLLFGGLFLAYAYYRSIHPVYFHLAGMELDTALGTMNTIILITSSLTMALSITAMQKSNKVLSQIFLSLTVFLALSFMVNKYFEWAHKFEIGIYPGSDTLLNGPPGQNVFFGLYYVMTGLHGLHIIIGLVVIVFVMVFIAKDKITPDNNVIMGNAGLYWHLVDLIWIFLFPLFYLIQ
jgi:cytochrome c oxidase subunit 3